jgi:hypothetical protein
MKSFYPGVDFNPALKRVAPRCLLMSYPAFTSCSRGLHAERLQLREETDYHFDKQASKLTIPFQGASKIVVDGAVSLF